MIECIVLGDSIAVGTHQQRNECVSYAKAGINSWQWNKNYASKPLSSRSVIISLGTNDHHGVNTFKELLKMRERVTAEHVYWIMPPCNDKFCKQDINDIVEIIARNYGDTIIGTTRVQSDGIHPSWTGYKELANQTKGN